MDKEAKKNHIDDVIYSRQVAQKQQGIKLAYIAVVVIVFFMASLFAFKAINSKKTGLDDPVVILETTPIDNSKVRGLFKQKLLMFEQETQPIIDNPELSNWNKQSVDAALNQKNNAISEFSKSKYNEALQELASAINKALTVNDEWNQAFQEKFIVAKTAYEDDKLNQSKLAISQALKIKPSNPEALALKLRIDFFPEIQRLYRELKVAKAENNVKKQIAVLSNILALDAEQQAAQEELEKLSSQMLEITFQGHINDGLQATAAKDFTKASSYYKKAKNLFPKRKELKVLKDRLDRVRAESDLSAVHSHLARLEKEDNWNGVRQLVTQAQNRFNSDPVLSGYKKLSDVILSLQKQSLIFTSKPERLSDDNVKRYAEKFIEQAVPYIKHSKTLANTVREVVNAIEIAAIKLPVTVTSDGKTNIQVLKTGTVGATIKKTINLSAGTYTFVGSRNGYKTKQLTITIGNGLSSQVYLVCDEKI